MYIKTKPEPLCPECLEKMILRMLKTEDNWEPFWGCQNYPECKGTRNILPNGEPESDEDFQDWDDNEWFGEWDYEDG